MRIHWKGKYFAAIMDSEIEQGQDLHIVDHPHEWKTSIVQVLEMNTPRNKELYITSYEKYSDKIHLAPKLRIQASIRIQKILKKRTKEIIKEIQSLEGK